MREYARGMELRKFLHAAGAWAYWRKAGDVALIGGSVGGVLGTVAEWCAQMLFRVGVDEKGEARSWLEALNGLRWATLVCVFWAVGVTIYAAYRLVGIVDDDAAITFEEWHLNSSVQPGSSPPRYTFTLWGMALARDKARNVELMLVLPSPAAAGKAVVYSTDWGENDRGLWRIGANHHWQFVVYGSVEGNTADQSGADELFRDAELQIIDRTDPRKRRRLKAGESGVI